jgi:hypothetical protein
MSRSPLKNPLRSTCPSLAARALTIPSFHSKCSEPALRNPLLSVPFFDGTEAVKQVSRHPKFAASAALLVARIPEEALLAQALKDITQGRFNDAPISVREPVRAAA